jgi:hypothetical protein
MDKTHCVIKYKGNIQTLLFRGNLTECVQYLGQHIPKELQLRLNKGDDCSMIDLVKNYGIIPVEKLFEGVVDDNKSSLKELSND